MDSYSLRVKRMLWGSRDSGTCASGCCSTFAGFLYLAVVLDAWSRRVIGWAMATHLRTELVLTALDMALEQRQPHDVIHHSDHGCQYTAVAYGQRCCACSSRVRGRGCRWGINV